MLKNVFPMSLLFFLILYSVWHRAWHRISLHNYVTLSTASQSFKNNLKFSMNRYIFTLHGSIQPCTLVIILNTCIRWITTQSRVYWLIQKYSHQYDNCMTMVLRHRPPFCSSSPKISEGDLFWRSFISWQNIDLSSRCLPLIKCVYFKEFQ